MKKHTYGLICLVKYVTLRSKESHLYHVVSFSTSDVFLFFPFVFIIILLFYTVSISD